ncbi:MAG: putative membrane protein [Parcubacteria group bacterium Gr01-1014_8]|nr:MAG: putative membrane protein [Parcubacteria group bacterium Gr01-1014_8]
MKKLILTFLSIVVVGSFAQSAHAQMMGGFSNSAADWNAVVEHTAREEQEGKELRSKLQAKEVACADLNNEQYGVLGEYFMGQMAGDSHAAMNAMMIQAHGADGEEQIHIVMGKRLSGCDTSAAFPAISGGWMPMMNMMWGGWSSPLNTNQSNNSMMNFGLMPFGGFGWIFMVLFWGFVIWMIVSMIRGNFGAGHMGGHSHGNDVQGKSAFDILKERYAKGEIDKSEFEEKKKDLGV